MRKIIRHLLAAVFIFSSLPVLAEEGPRYGFEKFESVSKLFSSGMNKEALEKAMNGKLVENRPGIFSLESSWQGTLAKYTFILDPTAGLQGIVIEFEADDKAVENLLGQLKNVYGEPTGESAGPKAYQWADESSDVGLVIYEQQVTTGPGNHVLLGFKKTEKSKVVQTYGPGQLSVFSGVYLGMSPAELREKFVFAPLSDAGNGRLSADVTFHLRPAQVIFVFEQDYLLVMVVEVPLMEDELSATDEWFAKHKTFLSSLYGAPTDERERYAVWADGAVETGLAWAEELKSFILRYRLKS